MTYHTEDQYRAAEALTAYIESEDFVSENLHDRFLTEDDFPVGEADEADMTDDDWEFVRECLWVDPFERDC